MKMSGNTVLITGGSSGIGFELAKQLTARGNKVIAAGRDPNKLAVAAEKIPELQTSPVDVSRPETVRELYDQIISRFPETNILINCAGLMRKIDLQAQMLTLDDITREVGINLNGTIWMDLQFLTHLKGRANAAIVNVSSGLAFIPFPISPIYSATEAAIHAFTQSLRLQLKNTAIKVFELAPPATETPLFHGDFRPEDTSGVKPMSVETLARRAIAGMEKDNLEIRPGLANVLKLASRVAPDLVLRQLGKSVDLMHAEA